MMAGIRVDYDKATPAVVLNVVDGDKVIGGASLSLDDADKFADYITQFAKAARAQAQIDGKAPAAAKFAPQGDAKMSKAEIDGLKGQENAHGKGAILGFTGEEEGKKEPSAPTIEDKLKTLNDKHDALVEALKKAAGAQPQTTGLLDGILGGGGGLLGGLLGGGNNQWGDGGGNWGHGPWNRPVIVQQPVVVGQQPVYGQQPIVVGGYQQGTVWGQQPVVVSQQPPVVVGGYQNPVFGGYQNPPVFGGQVMNGSSGVQYWPAILTFQGRSANVQVAFNGNQFEGQYV